MLYIIYLLILGNIGKLLTQTVEHLFHVIICRYYPSIITDWSYRKNYLSLRRVGIYRSAVEHGQCQTVDYRRRQLCQRPGRTDATATGSLGRTRPIGSQFQVVQYKETKPATLTGIEKYLGSGLIKGVGPVTAKRIVKHFGLDTLEIIENRIHRLSEVPGIARKESP